MPEVLKRVQDNSILFYGCQKVFKLRGNCQDTHCRNSQASGYWTTLWRRSFRFL